MGQAEQQALMAQLMGVLALLLYSLEAGVEAEVEAEEAEEAEAATAIATLMVVLVALEVQEELVEAEEELFSLKLQRSQIAARYFPMEQKAQLVPAPLRAQMELTAHYQ